MEKKDALNVLSRHKLIVILRKIPDNLILPVVQALYDGGVRVCEMTFCPDGTMADDAVARQINAVKTHFADDMVVGAGTVLAARQVVLAADAGAQIIVSPDVNAEVIAESNRLSLVSVPGALTPTEAMTAHRAGADYIKIFPAGTMSPEYFSHLTAPLPHLKMLAVGGVTPDNAQAFLRSGATGLGISSGIVPRGAVSCGDTEKIKNLAEMYVDLIKNA